jgi:hypothetical protein
LENGKKTSKQALSHAKVNDLVISDKTAFDTVGHSIFSISTDLDCLVITGDFNFHTDELNDKCAKKYKFTILDTFELS